MAASKASGLMARRNHDLIVHSRPLSSVLGVGLAYGGMFGLLQVVQLHQPVGRAALLGILALAAASGTAALLRHWFRVRIERDGDERIRVRAWGQDRTTDQAAISVVVRPSWPLSWQRDVVVASEDLEMAAIKRLPRRTAERLRAELASELGLTV